MPMGEHTNETTAASAQSCAKCGSALVDGKPVVVGEPGRPACDSCGAALVPVQVVGATNAAVPPQPRGRNPLALIFVALVAAGMLYFGLHMARRSGGNNPPPFGFGTPAPNFTLETLDGKTLSLSDFKGKAVVVNFWATWCGPCKIETPWLVELQNQYGSQGLQVVGVAMDDSGKDEIARFAKDMGMNYPVLLGKEAVGDAYGGVPALPESFFVGRDGKIVDRIIGLKGRSEIEDSVKKALDTQAAGTSAQARIELK